LNSQLSRRIVQESLDEKELSVDFVDLKYHVSLADEYRLIPDIKHAHLERVASEY
jgi:hypothetical protein